MTTQDTLPNAAARKNRTALLVIIALFLGTMFVAGALRFSGWRPSGMKNNGELLKPYPDLRAYSPTLADGTPYRWQDSPRTWRIMTLPEGCDGARHAACQHLLFDLDKVWRLMGKNADRVHVLWAGAVPVTNLAAYSELRVVRADAGLRAGLPRAHAETAKGDTVWLIDPNGFVVLRYAPGFDPGDLRTDLSRLLRIN